MHNQGVCLSCGTCGTQFGSLPWNTGNIVVQTHAFFYVTYTRLHPFPLFLLLFLPFWASSPHKWCTCCPFPMWNGLSLWALMRWQGLGSMGVVASQDATPKGRGSTDPKWFYGTMGFVGFGGNLLKSQLNETYGGV